ncbi:MAG: spermidine/putrescine ABC transporter permease [Magnetovibrio sp.]|nr:spermidine/putrescine ABC transporter permease [Magnetovibrio sp.]|tara:strand:- start:945 stop:1817 length:873 start_codon:yes stop_codon:yes gene_type:complete
MSKSHEWQRLCGGKAFEVAWRIPLIAWQAVFFIGPLLFMIIISFFLVKNYRMIEAFEFVNWFKMLQRATFWDSFGYTLLLASLSTVLVSIIAFPASYGLAFRVSSEGRRWAIFLLIVPFFTSYLVRIFSWYVVLAEAGPLNAVFGFIGLGPYTMLNTAFGSVVGYMTLTLPLVIILQTISLSNIDRRCIEAAYNLGCGVVRVILEVIVPMARTGLIVAALFCFILSFGDFVSPYYLGGSKPPTLPILIIDTTKSGQQWPRAAVIAVMMMLTLFSIAFSAIWYAYRKRVAS